MYDLIAVFMGRLNTMISLQPLTVSEIWGRGWYSLAEEERREIADFALSLATEDGRSLRGVQVEGDDIMYYRYSVNPHLLQAYAALAAQEERGLRG